MKITVQRGPDAEESVPGTLLVDNQFECFSLERPRDWPHPAIPAGTYSVILSYSPHLNYITPELENVPGRTAIRIHVANRAEELLGCIAVGQTRPPVAAADTVGNSKKAFESLMTLLRTATDPLSITILDPQ